MWEKLLQPDRPKMTIWRMRIACWVTKAKDAHSEYAIFIALPRPQWLRERASMLCYTTLPVLLRNYLHLSQYRTGIHKICVLFHAEPRFYSVYFHAICVVNPASSSNFKVQLKRDGIRWRTGGEVKGKLANGVGSQYSSHYLGTWCIQHYYRWCSHLGCPVVDWTDAPRRFKWTRPFRRKTKSGFCACAITFQKQSTKGRGLSSGCKMPDSSST
jgi:hypothetical protein